MATVPVFTVCPYFAVWYSANFLPKASVCLPGNGCPPQFRLVTTSSSAARSFSVKTGQGSKRFFRIASPPVIASFPIDVLLRKKLFETEFRWIGILFRTRVRSRLSWNREQSICAPLPPPHAVDSDESQTHAVDTYA